MTKKLNCSEHDVIEEAVRQFTEVPLDESSLPAALAATRQALSEAVISHDAERGAREHGPSVWRSIAKSKWTRLTIAAATIAIASTAGVFLFSSSAPAYAVDQTTAALRSVRFIHTLRSDPDGKITCERWTEIDHNGWQIRARQEVASQSLYVEDYHAIYQHRINENTVLLYPKEDTYQWIFTANWHRFLDDIGGEETPLIEENVSYNGRPAHLVVWLRGARQRVYVDPDTKLPIAMVDPSGEITQFSFDEEPPQGAFDVPAIPEGVILVDKRAGDEDPAWMKEREAQRARSREARPVFAEGRRALAARDYERARELLTQVVEIAPGLNWAWFRLAQAHMGLGDHERAVEVFSHVLDMLCDDNAWVADYVWFARGRAYRQLGIEEKARHDFGMALPGMIGVLRPLAGDERRIDGRSTIRVGEFDAADDPLSRGQGFTSQQRLARMIARLREVTGQDFGYDPQGTPEQREGAIVAWETWWQEKASEYEVRP